MSLNVKVLKSACCTTGKSIKEELNTAAANIDADIQVETVSDLKKSMKYGVLNFPSIIINGKAYDYHDLDGIHDLEKIIKEHSTQ